MHNHEKFFIRESTNSIYLKHLASYKLKPTGEESIIPFLSVKFRWPLSVYRYKGEGVVMNCHSHCCEVF